MLDDEIKKKTKFKIKKIIKIFWGSNMKKKP
jgi:hypothetical protein